MGSALMALWTLPARRSNESEADATGLRILARACYDVEQAPRFFERLFKMEGSSVGWLSDHPPSDERAATIRANCGCAKELGANEECRHVRTALRSASDVL